MQKLNQGYFMYIAMMGLAIVAFLMQQLFDELLQLARTVYAWQQENADLRQLTTTDVAQFSLDWQALGVYPCIQYCHPNCFGTRHWMLNLKLGHYRMILRLMKPEQGLICQLPHPLHLQHVIIWKRIVVTKT